MYWYHSLRDRDAIAAWCPGAPPALVPAHDIATPVTALAELAADEADGSPAAALCSYLAREVRYRGCTSTTRHITELRKNAAEGGDGAYLVLGALPAPLTRPPRRNRRKQSAALAGSPSPSAATSSHTGSRPLPWAQRGQWRRGIVQGDLQSGNTEGAEGLVKRARCVDIGRSHVSVDCLPSSGRI
ncbi:hypothetical protein [Streptomyces sp. NPDC057545]|uniref:hypothetical protein n=1 Tax=Streptomyces sp. NPDC057545 TaxID=3346164 RepID=UPI003687AF21